MQLLYRLTDTLECMFQESSEPFVADLTGIDTKPGPSGLLEVVC